MKNMRNYIGVAAVILLSTFLFSCKKSFLEVNPKGRLIASSVDDYSGLLNSLDLLNLGSSSAHVVMGDDAAAVEPYFSGTGLKVQRLFRWDALIYQQDEDADEIGPYLQNIYVFNKIINETLAATGGTEEQKLSVIAEARASRAWSYFMLINFFGKPYNTTTAAADPGFPIVREADVTVTSFTRASVQEVYDFIISDLQAAIPNLPATTTHRLRMSRAAAEGLLGKVYVFMGNFNAALPLLNSSLTDINGSTVPVALYNYNLTFAAGGAFMPISIFGPTYPTPPNNQEILFAKQAPNVASDFFAAGELVLSPGAASLYNPADLRLNFFASNPFGGPTYPAGLLKRNAPGSLLMGVLLTDIYLLRAECKARLNDLPGAVSDLQMIRTRRLPQAEAAVPSNVAGQQLPLLRFIIDERTREYSLTGFRWFDMRRLSVDPLFSSTTYTHTLFSETGTVTSTFTLSADRYVLRLPTKILRENPGMQDNP
ncbi:SusD family protein [Pedobacter westerhofensis]|uniref:SusD family protein n=1 Tax=Pedobacter westerhofensis TaxID=425512 RepID=A0A521FTY4_9SPHI|nr:RagB/SusD family nutrient uptake outer membrane protein [Pedobacter westerhofensis]SMO99705.1 SusD family protein [Pedobacter westerhofensis]